MAVENKEDMGQILAFVLKQAANQGFSVMLLILATVYFHWQNDKLQTKVDACMDMRFEQMEGKMLHMQTVIEGCSRALDRNTRVLQKMTTYKFSDKDKSDLDGDLN